MSDTEQIHDLFKSAGDFENLVHGMDYSESIHELRVALKHVGDAVQDRHLDGELSELDPIILGWMWICWEAHHPAKRIEGHSFADGIEERTI